LIEAFEVALAGRSELARTLAGRVGHPDDPEASLRFQNGELRAGRMMIERSDVETAKALAAGLGLPWTTQAQTLCQLTVELELPLIIGWDVQPDALLYKLYANASDRALEVRAELARTLQVTSADPPHLVGLNVSHGGGHLKAYFQRPSAPAMVARAELAPEAIAGWIVSADVRGDSLDPRAVFAAISDSHRSEAERVIEASTGLSWSAVAARFPFEPGPVRQIGWGRDGSLTIYAKRKNAAPALHGLEPIAIFAAGEVEVGLHLEPIETTPRAFARTRRAALSFRARSGQPGGVELERLGAWAEARVTEGETSGLAPVFDQPPAPWKLRK
jgi:hypothetical protein